MAVLEILHVPNPMLRKVSVKVAQIDDEVRQNLTDMMDTLNTTESGVAIAAPQVGIFKRMVIIHLGRGKRAGEDTPPVYAINPEILEASEEMEPMEEGCLSVPEEWAEVTRPSWVKCRYTDLDGNEQIIETEGFLAKCIQHEIDHLDGILFIDKLSKLKKDVMVRRVKKRDRMEAEALEYDDE